MAQNSRRYVVPAILALLPSGVNGTTTLTATPFTDVYRTGGEPMIVNGQRAHPAEYPASYRSESGGRVCTWFLVGPSVLLGAAHCVTGTSASAPLAEVRFASRAGQHIATCSIPEGYWTDRSQDWALCKVSPQVPRPVGANGSAGYEVVSQKPEVLASLPRLEISGFGCTVQGGSARGEYQIGIARVVTAPPRAKMLGSASATPNAVKIRQAPSNLCAGDSGGPAFYYQKPAGRILRVVVGTNSSTVIEAGVGYLASLSTPAAVSFFKAWSLVQSEKICGINKDARGCRSFLP